MPEIEQSETDSQEALKQHDAPEDQGRAMRYVLPLLIVVAWGLVAIPGSYVGGFNSLQEDRSHFNHGWPLVHMQSTTVDVAGVWDRGKLLPYKTLTADQYQELAAERAESRGDDVGDDESMLNLYPKVAEGESLAKFWNVENWPIASPRRNVTWKIPGLIGNVVTLGLLLFAATTLVKRFSR